MAYGVRRVVAATLAALLTAGCGLGSGPTPPDKEPQPAVGAQSPAIAPLPGAAADRVAMAANDTGFDILFGLTNQQESPNVIISPISLATVLSMLHTGADGETAAAIGRVLNLADPSDRAASEGFAALLQSVAGTGSGVELSVANSLWPRTGYPLQPAFLSQMQQDFDATVREVDLGDPQTATEIDRWVSDQTQGRIPKMAADLGVPDPGLVLILLNAVYFKGEWTTPFDPAQTRTGAFSRPDYSEVDVPFMSQRGEYLYANACGFEMVRIPYGKDGRFGIELFLPELELRDNPPQLTEMAWSLTAAELKPRDMMLSLPRFELAYHATGLDKVLQSLGMRIAYSAESDFTPMSPADPWLSTVQHKTFLKVDEKGTEAAAVTGAAMDESAPPQYRVDRPFLFTISDTQTGAILFAGQVTDPTAGG